MSTLEQLEDKYVAYVITVDGQAGYIIDESCPEHDREVLVFHADEVCQAWADAPEVLH